MRERSHLSEGEQINDTEAVPTASAGKEESLRWWIEGLKIEKLTQIEFGDGVGFWLGFTSETVSSGVQRLKHYLPLVIGEEHALSSAARLCDDTLFLTRAAVFVVVLQVIALVVATCGVPAVFQGVVAHFVVLVAVVGGSRVSLLLLEEMADVNCGDWSGPVFLAVAIRVRQRRRGRM
ncbi:hypothetical protein SASPL_114704 [Salvia splendens]|uniref:Uncharacterized protein n=1 Tax=Salvia splendens TaxID=180675 RepID=A0A8X9A2B1_SALSN|nr:hypothetical protein SASPL_114704 [Salvia splendens]